MVFDDLVVDVLAIITAVIILIGLYIYIAFSWMCIAKKVNYKKPWLAFIPFANVAMWLEMGGFHWALVFLLLIPFLGWITIVVLLIISHWKIYQELGYHGWLVIFVLLDLVPGLLGVGTVTYSVITGIVAWKNK